MHLFGLPASDLPLAQFAIRQLGSLPAQVHFAAYRTPLAGLHFRKSIEGARGLIAHHIAARVLTADQLEPRVFETRNSVEQCAPQIHLINVRSGLGNWPVVPYE